MKTLAKILIILAIMLTQPAYGQTLTEQERLAKIDAVPIDDILDETPEGKAWLKNLQADPKNAKLIADSKREEIYETIRKSAIFTAIAIIFLVFAKSFVTKNINKFWFRLSISIYTFWVILLVLTNNFEFEDVFDFEYYDELRTLRLLTIPPFLLILGYFCLRWCRKAYKPKHIEIKKRG